jgi:hypothetical protein
MPYKNLEKRKEYSKQYNKIHKEELKKYSRKKHKEYYRIKHNLSLSFIGDYRKLRAGSENNLWLGDKVGYHGKHKWIKKLFGKATHCENNPNHKTKRYEWANITGKYTRNKKDYKQLCVSCYRKFDKGNFCIRGHRFTKKNTWIRKNGWRVCKICQKIRHNRFTKKGVYHL